MPATAHDPAADRGNPPEANSPSQEPMADAEADGHDAGDEGSGPRKADAPLAT